MIKHNDHDTTRYQVLSVMTKSIGPNVIVSTSIRSSTYEFYHLTNDYVILAKTDDDVILSKIDNDVV